MDNGFKNNSNLMNLDLESFLATMIIPPPPQTNGQPEEKRANVLTSEEISSFIIPPPPPKPIAVVENQPKPGNAEDQIKKITTSVSAATTPDGPSATNEKTLPGFSCCSRQRPRSPDSQQAPGLPTRAQNMTLPRVKPKVPPRIDSTLSTKPPLPPMPSQVRKSSYSFVLISYVNIQHCPFPFKSY